MTDMGQQLNPNRRACRDTTYVEDVTRRIITCAALHLCPLAICTAMQTMSMVRSGSKQHCDCLSQQL